VDGVQRAHEASELDLYAGPVGLDDQPRGRVAQDGEADRLHGPTLVPTLG
jgi:hypothetical protein